MPRNSGPDKQLLGRIAYGAYGARVSWVTFDGRPMPAWEDLSDSVQRGWVAAGSAVGGYVLEPVAVVEVPGPPAPAEPEPRQAIEPVYLDDTGYPVDGTIAQVLEWVNGTDDQELHAGRAQYALNRERERPTTRVTLLDALKYLVNPDG